MSPLYRPSQFDATLTPANTVKAIVTRLEQLLDERNTMIEEYAALWAVHGGGSDTWENHLVAIDTAPLKEAVRARLAGGGRAAKVSDIKEALLLEPEYQARLRKAIEGRTEWARVRERWNTLGWRIQLEMAKLRLELGDEATPTDSASDSETAVGD